MSASNDRLLAAGAAVGKVLHESFCDLSQAERVFILNACLQQELNPPEDEGMSYEEFEKIFETVTTEPATSVAPDAKKKRSRAAS
jgi:hypothetical protein